MSDSRNGAGNLRGGGSKQSGGSGRTAKGAHQKGGKNDLLGYAEVDRNAEAREFLEMKMLSKKLASSIKAACLNFRTEAEYKRFNVEMPDPAAVIKKLKDMRGFTQAWRDKDFRAQWLLRVQAVWEKELLADVEAAIKAAKLAEAGDNDGAKAVLEARAREKEKVETQEAHWNEKAKSAGDSEEAFLQAKMAAMAVGDAVESGGGGEGGSGSTDKESDETQRQQNADAALIQRQKEADAAMAELLAEEGGGSAPAKKKKNKKKKKKKKLASAEGDDGHDQSVASAEGDDGHDQSAQL